LTICTDSDEERPANMMRAVKSPLIVTGGRSLARGMWPSSS
jgi:hypothetical protein